MNYRLSGTFTLRSPLSHIGESHSTTSFLVEEPVLQPDGSVEQVFCYSGNAWRGQLRDLSATYMLEHLGAPMLPVDSFHLLFSGGRIGGEQAVDIEQARRYRRIVPMLALFGGGVGNQILPGKLRVGNSYPVCREAMVALPAHLGEVAAARSYRELTFIKDFSRRDDSRDDRLGAYLLAPPEGEQRRRDDGPADQMRMSVELVAAGTQLATEIDALDVSEIELGALVSALHQFSRSPHIGGQANRGHGRVDLQYVYTDLDSGESGAFVAVHGGVSLLAPPAEEAKWAYDQFLREQYDRLLAAQGGDMLQVLGAGGQA
jgi:hypothetical protein